MTLAGPLIDAVALALGAIVRNKLRAALTILGIFIGITAVVIVTAAATTTTAAVGGEIDSFAANALFVWPQPVQASGARSRAVGRLTEADGRAIARDAVSVANVAPFLSTQGQVVYGDKNWATNLVGTTLPYFPIRRYAVGRGSSWTESDELLKTKVCLVGQTVASNLFGNQDPVGRTIRIGRSPYTIVGVLAPRGTSPFGEDQDDRVMMPIGSFRSRVMHTAPGRADQLIVGATSDQTVNRAKAQIEDILRQRHHLEPGRDDFAVSSQSELRESTDAIMATLAALLLSVAGVSLLVGGIGVMNIMLVSVAERTREIGIRMSIGARERDILVQFLVEAIALTMIGGVLGIAAGSGITLAIGRVLSSAVAPSARALGVAVATSVAIGTVFGFLPAWRAAKLDPIAALRVE
ncbi:MAG TPA: ABC transporter permease [Polyangiaceae bacterium]|nr:ABC transporter permease [Polyangiaceae bacterium]